MIPKAVLRLALVFLGALIANQWQDRPAAAGGSA